MSHLLVDAPEGEILRVGEKAPDFVLDTESEKKWRLSEQFGQVTALLFYPQNETLVCNRQLCSVRDNWQNYLETKASIVAISPGTPEEHRKFSDRHYLPLPILADVDRTVTKTYCEHWFFPVRLIRGVIVIDAKGILRYRQIMLRVFRPTDSSVIQSILAARTDFIYDHFEHLIGEAREKNKQFL